MRKVKIKTIALGAGECVIAVVPEFCSGPGWNNAPAWVYIRDAAGKLRTECVQPHERTSELHTLFAVGAEVQRALAESVPCKERRK